MFLSKKCTKKMCSALLAGITVMSTPVFNFTSAKPKFFLNIPNSVACRPKIFEKSNSRLDELMEENNEEMDSTELVETIQKIGKSTTNPSDDELNIVSRNLKLIKEYNRFKNIKECISSGETIYYSFGEEKINKLCDDYFNEISKILDSKILKKCDVENLLCKTTVILTLIELHLKIFRKSSETTTAEIILSGIVNNISKDEIIIESARSILALKSGLDKMITSFRHQRPIKVNQNTFNKRKIACNEQRSNKTSTAKKHHKK